MYDWLWGWNIFVKTSTKPHSRRPESLKVTSMCKTARQAENHSSVPLWTLGTQLQGVQDKQLLYCQALKSQNLSKVLIPHRFENKTVCECMKKMDVMYTDLSLHIIYIIQLALVHRMEKPTSQNFWGFINLNQFTPPYLFYQGNQDLSWVNLNCFFYI